MKRIKHLWKIMLLCMCIVSGGVFAPITSYAQEVTIQIQPRMTYITSCNVKLTISDSGMATIAGSVRGKAGVTSTYVKLILQKSVSGSWTDVEEWEDSNTGRSTTIDETYEVSKGTYRVVMTCRANTETQNLTSTSKTY